MRRVFVVAAFATFVATPASAQKYYWRIPATLGGALVGAGIGYGVDIMTWSGGLGGPTLIGTSIGIVGGGLIGFAAGAGADSRLARGDTLNRGTRRALRFTTFLAPVAVGSAIAFAIINPSEDTYSPNYSAPATDDGTVALLGIGGGIVLGYVLQHKTAKYLWPRPRVGIAPAPGGGVSASLNLRWEP